MISSRALKTNSFGGEESARRKHPWERILVRRDEISREESSLEEDVFRRDEICEGEASLREDFYPQG